MSIEEISNSVANINPEPIGIFTLPNHKHLKYKKTLEKICEETPNDSELISGSKKLDGINNLSYRICHDNDQHIFEQFEILSDLKEDIHTVLLSYIKRTGYLCDQMVINDAWVNMDGRNSSLGFHYHTNSFLSGTYYVSFDKEKHTSLNFVNDRLTANRKGPGIDIPINEDSPTVYNQKFLSVPIEEGKILIWRSHLTHGFVKPNIADDRLTLSFNAMPKTCRNTAGHYSFTVGK